MNSEISTPTSTFARMLPSERFSAGLARRLALGRLAAWGLPEGSEAAEATASVIAELAANAVTHGRVPGRDFELRVTLDPDAGVIRVEVSDARGERRPGGPHEAPSEEAESGRGLLLVEALSRAWGVSSREVGKTVWAEVALPGGGYGPQETPDGREPAGTGVRSATSRSDATPLKETPGKNPPQPLPSPALVITRSGD